MGHWVYEFSGYPDMGCYQQIANEMEPGEVVVCERVGCPGIVDGFVRESIDDVMMVVHFRWVASGDPSTVMPEVLRACGLRRRPTDDSFDVLREISPVWHDYGTATPATGVRPTERPACLP